VKTELGLIDGRLPLSNQGAVGLGALVPLALEIFADPDEPNLTYFPWRASNITDQYRSPEPQKPHI